MRNADTILNIVRERGRRRKPLGRVYRLLYCRDLYLRAYAKLYKNEGAMTQGTTPETIDSMSLLKIDALIEALRFERHRWKPARRIYIPKKNGKRRPLGMPSFSDKLLQEVIRLILDAYYEPQFSANSHGFRPGRGCHTALRQVRVCGKGAKWFIEGDLSACFDSIDHKILVKILKERIHDGRFIHLIERLLKAGYLEKWSFHNTYSGVPQGGVLSPVLTNIVLDRLDKHVETLIPKINKGKRRISNPEYQRLRYLRFKAGKSGQAQEALKLRKLAQQIPVQDPRDKNYRRLWYVRYADDFLLGVIGPRSDALKIKNKISKYLKEKLHLELSLEKTLITHAVDSKAKFLGYEIHAFHCDTKHSSRGRSINGHIGLRVPRRVIQDQSQKYMVRGKPIHLTQRVSDNSYSIVTQYQAEYNGVVQYYKLAYNLCSLNRLRWVAQGSLVKTLACKYKTTSSKIYERFAKTISTPKGTYKVLEVTLERGSDKKPLKTHFGAVSLKWDSRVIIHEKKKAVWNGRSELVERLLAQTCELCGSKDNIEVHHIRKLSDLNRKNKSPKAEWQIVMNARKRKTLVSCRSCHITIHAGRYDGAKVA